jgi:catechol 2,3-dioxygenase-like lactoylglutathione lyase family enzyme
MREQNPINITALDHVVIRAVDIETMLTFYCDVLGCRLERTLDQYGLYQLRAGASLIDLVDVDGPIGKEGGGRPVAESVNMDHFCLQVHPWNEDAILNHLQQCGVGDAGTLKVAMRYGAQGSGPSIYLNDPEGNRVELKGS